MAKLHEYDIESELNARTMRGERRGYCGMSGIGNPCIRAIQYNHYWCYDSTYLRNIQRIFDTGHRAEPFMVRDIESLGYTVTNDQLEVIGEYGHWKGHIDGLIRKIYRNEDLVAMGDYERNNLEALLEMKTHNHSNFNTLVKKGVQKAFPKHYDQMTMYAGYLGLDKAVYLAYNKNNSMYHVETIDIDIDHYGALVDKSKLVIESEVLIAKIGGGRKTWFECRFCDARKVCHDNEPVMESCRSCAHVEVEDLGMWRCGKTALFLTKEDQLEGCSEYEIDKRFND